MAMDHCRTAPESLYRALSKHRLACRDCRLSAKNTPPLVRECAEGIVLRERWEKATRESLAPQTTAEAICDQDAQEARD